MAPKEGLAVHFLVFRSDSRELFHILNPHLYNVAPPSIGRFVEGFLFFFITRPVCHAFCPRMGRGLLVNFLLTVALGGYLVAF